MAFKRIATLMAAGILIGAAASAQATTLLNLEDPLGQSNTPFALTFTAGSASTTVTFEGYQVPAGETAGHIGLFLNGTGPNLLGQTWAFTPASSGTDTSQSSDGTSVNALLFAGVTEDSYDMYSQTIATIIGDVYMVDFLFTNSSNNQPSGLIVDASNANISSTPLPAALPLFAGGLGLMGFLARRRKRNVAA
jgi:hypothetical protein